MNKKNFFRKGFMVVTKFILAGLLAMSITVIVKNRMDLLSFSIAVIFAFALGGIAMALSLIRENNSLKRQLKKAKKEIADFNETLENVPVCSLIDFNESKSTSNKTA